jgi:NRPS condensation-like uncharacterized protein
MDTVPKQIPATYLDRAIGFISFLIDLTIQLELKFTEALDIERLRKAVYLTLDAEPILGCHLVSHWHRPYFQRMSRDSITAFYTTENVAGFNAFRSELIDTYQGPQLKVYLHHSSDEDRLLVKVTHNVTDVGGLNKIAHTISSIYSRLKDEPDYKPASNINASRSLRIVTKQLKWHAYPRIYFNYLQGLFAQMPRQGTHTLRFEKGPLIPLEFVHKLIPEERIGRMKEYGRAHNATLNDLMMAAIFRALILGEKWDRQSHLRLNTSVDLRRWYLSGEQDETIANLSAMEVLSLKDDIGDSFLATLERVVAFMENRKLSYIGLSDLIGSLPIMILPDVWGRNLYKKVVQRAINKNNIAPGLTNMGEIAIDAVTFDYPPDSAWLFAPPYYSPYFLIGLSGYKRTLSLSSVVRPSHKDKVIQLFENIISQLPAL